MVFRSPPPTIADLPDSVISWIERLASNACGWRAQELRVPSPGVRWTRDSRHPTSTDFPPFFLADLLQLAGPAMHTLAIEAIRIRLPPRAPPGPHADCGRLVLDSEVLEQVARYTTLTSLILRNLTTTRSCAGSERLLLPFSGLAQLRSLDLSVPEGSCLTRPVILFDLARMPASLTHLDLSGTDADLRELRHLPGLEVLLLERLNTEAVIELDVFALMTRLRRLSFRHTAVPADTDLAPLAGLAQTLDCIDMSGIKLPDAWVGQMAAAGLRRYRLCGDPPSPCASYAFCKVFVRHGVQPPAHGKCWWCRG
jgi:hypothetical protein